MVQSSAISYPAFKSPARSLCRSFFRSRQSWRVKAAQRQHTIDQLHRELHVARRLEEQRRAQVADLQRQLEQLQSVAPTADPLSDGPKLPGHQFGAAMISLCCRLSNLIGFRAIPKVLRCVADCLGLPWKIPSRDAVRNWNCRNGVAILHEAEEADDWIWLVDHSVQLGKMFVLAVLGIRQSELPQRRALQRDDMTPLAVLPTDSRNKQVVGEQFQQVAARFGTPLAIVSDGACELHEGARQLESAGFSGVCIDDVKHKVANLLKKTLGRDERFAAFEKQLGQTTATIQQTELEHLLPPRKKQKCRFMNFDRLIDWTTMVQRQLDAPEVPPRVVEKLGWISEFSQDLACWRQCRQLIGCVLSFTNRHGVYCGASAALAGQLAELPATAPLAERLRDEMISFSQCNEAKLLTLGRDTLRLPCSTEVLESAFGSFKAIQRHHHRGTFTTLLAVFPTLFDRCTPEKIRHRFAAVSNAALKSWFHESNLTNSTQSRQTKAYRQSDDPPAPLNA